MAVTRTTATMAAVTGSSWSGPWQALQLNDTGTPPPLDPDASTPVVELQQPSTDAAGPCLITLHLQQQPQQQTAACRVLVLVSNARTVEVAVQRPGDQNPAYVSTVRCTQQQGAAAEWWQGDISLQAATGCSVLQLKLLSLQGSSKRVCRIHSLRLVAAAEGGLRQQPDASPQQGAPAAEAPQPEASPPSQQQPLSQLDELRTLVQQLQRPGVATGGPSGAVPQSLQLLHDKAMRIPEAGPAAAMKTLSALLAQGMLHQAAQQRAGTQQQQQQGTSDEAPGLQQPAPASSLDSGTAQAVLQRLEAKLDSVLAAVQQLDRRLGVLEARVTERVSRWRSCRQVNGYKRAGQTALPNEAPQLTPVQLACQRDRDTTR